MKTRSLNEKEVRELLNCSFELDEQEICAKRMIEYFENKAYDMLTARRTHKVPAGIKVTDCPYMPEYGIWATLDECVDALRFADKAREYWEKLMSATNDCIRHETGGEPEFCYEDGEMWEIQVEFEERWYEDFLPHELRELWKHAGCMDKTGLDDMIEFYMFEERAAS